MKFLEKNPVADDMFYVIRHHREHARDKVHSEIAMVKRRKGDPFVFFLIYCHRESSTKFAPLLPRLSLPRLTVPHARRVYNDYALCKNRSR